MDEQQIIEEKSAFQKMVTTWIFNQSSGLVVSFLAIAICLYQNIELKNQQKMLFEKVERQEATIQNMLVYERNETKKTLEDNTRALEDFKVYIYAKQSR